MQMMIPQCLEVLNESAGRSGADRMKTTVVGFEDMLNQLSGQDSGGNVSLLVKGSEARLTASLRPAESAFSIDSEGKLHMIGSKSGAGPGALSPGIFDSGLLGPGIQDPGVAEPGIAGSGIADFGVSNSGVPDSDISDPAVPAIHTGSVPEGKSSGNGDRITASETRIDFRKSVRRPSPTSLLSMGSLHRTGRMGNNLKNELTELSDRNEQVGPGGNTSFQVSGPGISDAGGRDRTFRGRGPEPAGILSRHTTIAMNRESFLSPGGERILQDASVGKHSHSGTMLADMSGSGRGASVHGIRIQNDGVSAVKDSETMVNLGGSTDQDRNRTESEGPSSRRTDGLSVGENRSQTTGAGNHLRASAIGDRFGVSEGTGLRIGRTDMHGSPNSMEVGVALDTTTPKRSEHSKIHQRVTALSGSGLRGRMHTGRKNGAAGGIGRDAGLSRVGGGAADKAGPGRTPDKRMGTFLKETGQLPEPDSGWTRETASPGLRTKVFDIRTATTPNANMVLPERESFVDQITPALSRMLEEGESRLRIALHPENLGTLKIELVSDGEQVRARFFVESGEIKHLIESTFPDIKEALYRDGIVVEHFQVDIDRGSGHMSPYDDRMHGRGSNVPGNETPGTGREQESEETTIKTGTRYFGYNSMEIVA